MFPARAGMSRGTPHLMHEVAYVPRASGDEPTVDALNAGKDACSPRERG